MAKEKALRSRSLSSEDWCEVVRVISQGTQAIDIVIEPLLMGRSCWWGIVAVVDGSERIELGKSRHHKNERKVWKRFETIHAFLQKEFPNLEVVKLRMEPEREG